MKSFPALLLVFLLLAMLLPLEAELDVTAVSPMANGSPGCPGGCWTPISNATSPSLYQSGFQVIFAASFSSSYNTTTSGTVFATFQDGSYLYVANATENLMIGPGDNGTAKVAVSGLQVGAQYVATYYAVDANNDSISDATTVVLTVANSSPLQGTEPLSMVTSWLCNVACANLAQSPEVMVTFGDAGASIPIAVVHGVIRGGGVVSNETMSAVINGGRPSTFAFYVGGLAQGEYSLSVFVALANGSALSGTSVVSFQIQPNGLLFIGDKTDFSLLKAPTMVAIGNRAVELVYANNLNFTAVGIAWLIVHDSAGQTVFYSTSTLTPAGGVNGTTYNIIFGLAPGTYSATVFVTSVSAVAISSPSSFSFTI